MFFAVDFLFLWEIYVWFNVCFLMSLSTLHYPAVTHNVPAAWRSWDSAALSSGYHFNPNFAKPLVRGSVFLFCFLKFIVFC